MQVSMIVDRNGSNGWRLNGSLGNVDAWALAESLRGACILLDELQERILMRSWVPSDGCAFVSNDQRQDIVLVIDSMQPDRVELSVGQDLATNAPNSLAGGIAFLQGLAYSFVSRPTHPISS